MHSSMAVSLLFLKSIQLMAGVVVAVLVVVSFGGFAYASSPISHVGGTVVTEGQSSVELRFGRTEDNRSTSSDNRFRMRQHYDYGINDWHAIRLVTAQDKRGGDNLEHHFVRFENRFQLIERRNHGWDGGIRLIYGHSDGDKTPHEAEFRLMAQVPFGDDWEYRHNAIFEQDVGQDAQDGVAVELRNQLTKKIEPPHSSLKSLKIGLDMFNDLGRLRELSGYNDQDHQLGPVVKMGFDNGMFLHTSYRTGTSTSGLDHVVAFSVGRKF